jgi:hypothetical protein
MNVNAWGFIIVKSKPLISDRSDKKYSIRSVFSMQGMSLDAILETPGWNWMIESSREWRRTILRCLSNKKMENSTNKSKFQWRPIIWIIYKKKRSKVRRHSCEFTHLNPEKFIGKYTHKYQQIIRIFVRKHIAEKS